MSSEHEPEPELEHDRRGGQLNRLGLAMLQVSLLLVIGLLMLAMGRVLSVRLAGALLIVVAFVRRSEFMRDEAMRARMATKTE